MEINPATAQHRLEASTGANAPHEEDAGSGSPYPNKHFVLLSSDDDDPLVTTMLEPFRSTCKT
jgi:hypothetical protein